MDQQQTNPADVSQSNSRFILVTNIVNKFRNRNINNEFLSIDNWKYYGVFLDIDTRERLLETFAEYRVSGWTTVCDHMTIRYNDFTDESIARGRQLVGSLGQTVELEVVAIGKSDKALALKVNGYQSDNRIAHITLEHSKKARPYDSNNIQDWHPLETPIKINGTIGFSYKNKIYYMRMDENVIDFSLEVNIEHEKKYEKATGITIAFPERKEQLLALSPNDPGARMLEDMYEYNLLWDGINPRTPGKIQEEIAAAAKEADEIVIVTPTSESLSRQITNLILKDKLHDGDKIFIRDERMSELKTMEISSVRKEPNVEYDLKYTECSLSVFLHDNGTIKSCVEHYGKDLLGNHVDGAVYHFAKSGMLLSAEKGNAVQSPVHAIKELQKMVQENIGKMNVLEIAGLRDLVAKLNEPLSYFRHEMSNGDHVIGVSTRFSIDDRMGAFKELQDTIERNYEKARSEFFKYAGRGFRANNNLWDRLMRRTFIPTYPLPPMDDLKIEGRQYKQGAVSLDEIGTDKIPLDFYNRFLDRCLQPSGPDIDVNAMPKMPIMSDAQVFDKKQETEKHRSDLRAKAENKFQKMLDKAFCNKETESKSIGRGRVK